MIVPLKQVTLFCLEKDKNETLARLADLGMIHILTDAAAPESPGRTRAHDDAAAAERAVNAIRSAAALKPGQSHTLALRKISVRLNGNTPEPVRRANALADACCEASEEADALDKTIARYAPFGSFDPSLAQNIKKQIGRSVFLFSAPEKMVMPTVEDGWVDILFANDSEKTVYGVFIGKSLPEGLDPIALPVEPLDRTRSRFKEAMCRKIKAVEALAAMKSELPVIEEAAKSAAEANSFALALEAMKDVGPIAHITGYVDARKCEKLLEEAREQGWGIFLRDPLPEENPPTLLEPPKVFRPVLAIFKGLGILPCYTETDISVPFYAFFTIFFAMLIGDAGYGAIILALTVFGHRSLKKKFGVNIPELAKGALTLFYVFSFATIAYGLLTATIFGMPQTWLPASYAALPVVQWFADMNNVMLLCFLLGAIHLSIARLWNAVSLFPDTKFLAEIGWTGIVWSMFFIISSLVVKGFQQPACTIPLLVVSILLTALFMLHRNELKSNGVSLGMLPLNIISSMGDIISYLRLYAVGLASVKVAENFDTMAAGIELPIYAKIPVMLLILAAGHAINFAMGGLSILVHAVRLNTLEFSGAKGVTWGGYEFQSFTAKKPDSLPEPENALPNGSKA